MSSRLVDNISPALLAELDQASASMAAMVLIRNNGETELVARDGHTPAELVARDGHTPAELARALRNLALALDSVQDEYDAETERRRND